MPRSRKAATAAEVTEFTHIPNIGPAMAGDFARLGIRRPRDLIGRDAMDLYDRLCRVTGQRHDPCVIDAFMSAVDFMEGAPAAPWWSYTARRKSLVAKLSRKGRA